MGNSFWFDWEVSLMVFLQQLPQTIFKPIALFFTEFGEEAVLVVMLGLLYWCLNKNIAKYVGSCLLLTLTWTTLLKGTIMRRRPYMDHDDIKCLKLPHGDGDPMSPADQGYSCPSAHSSMTTAIFWSLANKVKHPVRYVFLFIPLFVGISRVYLGVHYPTDVLFGWFIGFVAMAVASLLDKFIHNRTILYLLYIALILPGIFFCTDVEYYTTRGVAIGFFLSQIVEERYINFEDATSFKSGALRLILGAAVFFAISKGLKLVVPTSFLESDGLPVYLFRSFRYFLGCFVSMGILPFAFKKCKWLQ